MANNKEKPMKDSALSWKAAGWYPLACLMWVEVGFLFAEVMDSSSTHQDWMYGIIGLSLAIPVLITGLGILCGSLAPFPRKTFMRQRIIMVLYILCGLALSIAVAFISINALDSDVTLALWMIGAIFPLIPQVYVNYSGWGHSYAVVYNELKTSGWFEQQERIRKANQLRMDNDLRNAAKIYTDSDEVIPIQPSALSTAEPINKAPTPKPEVVSSNIAELLSQSQQKAGEQKAENQSGVKRRKIDRIRR